MVGAGGLMATAQLAPIAKDFIAKDFNVGGIPVSILGITLPALTFALSIDRVLNRPKPKPTSRDRGSRPQRGWQDRELPTRPTRSDH
jgi:hypothetical protein